MGRAWLPIFAILIYSNGPLAAQAANQNNKLPPPPPRPTNQVLRPPTIPPPSIGGMSQTTPMTNQKTTPAKVIAAPPKPIPTTVVFMSPNLGITPHNANNCVYFLSRDLHVTLPGNLYTYKEKQNIANFQGTPRKGDVAIMKVNSGPDAPYGHLALITDVTSTSITIVEANYHAGIVDSRVSTAPTLQGAEQSLNITGFYRP
jgi:hypothetical protein